MGEERREGELEKRGERRRTCKFVVAALGATKNPGKCINISNPPSEPNPARAPPTRPKPTPIAPITPPVLILVRSLVS
jgi:hypothetical protein